MHELVQGPVVVHAHNVLDPKQTRRFRGDAGKSLLELCPSGKLPYLCLLNGDFVLPEDQHWIPGENDVVIYQVLPAGNGNVSMQVVGVILIAIGLYTGFQPATQAGIALLAAGSVPIPKPHTPTSSSTQSPSPTYDVSIGGNTARIGSPLPVVYGRHLLVPDFAGQPYRRFEGTITQTQTGTTGIGTPIYTYTVNDAEYYYAIFSAGPMEEFTVENVFIDKTPISNFTNVTAYWIGPQFPGVYNTDVDPYMLNSTQVTNALMKDYEPIGPFNVVDIGQSAFITEVDFILPKGLFHANDDGSLSALHMEIRVDYRFIDDAGNPIATGGTSGRGDGWYIGLGDMTLSFDANVTDPIRKTLKIMLGGRYQLRAVKNVSYTSSDRYAYDVYMYSMRTSIASSSYGPDLGFEMDPRCHYYVLRMLANDQLSEVSGKQLSILIRRKLYTWNPSSGWSTHRVETNNIAWIVADILKNPTYGAGLPDSRIDLQTLYELSRIWATRYDTCNIVFDTRVTVWEALQTVLQCGRARPIMRGGVVTFVRDQQQDLPTAVYNMRNIVKGSFSVNYTMTSEDTNDGIELTFMDETTWTENKVTLPIPGSGVTNPVNPYQITMYGITNKLQAQRECATIAAIAAYRRKAVTAKTEMEGYLPCYGELAAFSHDIVFWGTSGDIVAYDPTTFTATTSEPVVFGDGTNYAMMATGQADPWGPFEVVPGDDNYTMVFLEDVSTYMHTGTSQEHTRFSMGPADTYTSLCRIVGLSPDSEDLVQISAIVEDNRVHSADAPYVGDGNIVDL